MSRSQFRILTILAAAALVPPAAAEKFDATWESLEQYECPQWFRDAKFGIWTVWGPQSVVGAPSDTVNDWYARNMYIEGHPAYEHHVKHFGHPSKVGYKDIIARWEADKFDADRLAALFQRAGARYIVTIATFHDNFDLWDSRHHSWDSVEKRPGIDVVEQWREATRKRGLVFGVTTHLARSYSWFNVNKGADKRGPLAGVPYDGNDPAYQELYHPPHPDANRNYPLNPSEEWKESWFRRLKDLLDQHQPDLFYFDGGIPFGKSGRELVAYYYNENMKWNGGQLKAVMNVKNFSDVRHGKYLEGTAVLDMERGVQREIRDAPWQTDTSIGAWYWTRNDDYKSADTIVDTLADIVSKNGNLLLNVPPRGDGSLDGEVEETLEQIGEWLRLNGEAIYGTRPWEVYGEGPTRIASGNFQERTQPSTAEDVRFTQKDDTLYAIVLGWPGEGAIIDIRSLGEFATDAEFTKVGMLGYSGDLDWTHDGEALHVQMPPKQPCDFAVVVKLQLR